MSIKLGVIMDPIGSINIKKDSTFAMLLSAQARKYELFYMELRDLAMLDGQSQARMRRVTVQDDPGEWFSLEDEQTRPLADLDVVLMRKDPPFDLEYIYATYFLERAALDGALIINNPRSLRDANEKMFTAWFPSCCPTTLVTRSHDRLNEFLRQHENIVVKPLDGMGGSSVFKVQTGDLNRGVIFETLTAHETRYAMAQRFIPEIKSGDKRILMIEGEPVDYALARVPAANELRGNLAAGARGQGVPLSDADRRICETVGPALRERGLVFVGLDVIGDYLTEINVTSPTCIRELDAEFGLDIAGRLMDAIEARLHAHER